MKFSFDSLGKAKSSAWDRQKVDAGDDVKGKFRSGLHSDTVGSVA